MTLDECRREMRSIIRELRDIEYGVCADFSGIGERLCGDCVEKNAQRCEYTLRRLERVSENVFSK